MPNITLSVDEETYRAARVEAAKRDTTVSGLVRDYLNNLNTSAAHEERVAALMAAIAATKGSGFTAAGRLTRDQAHDRQALR
jgi:RecB family exonuclease